jgi:hypothetical protein
MAEEFSFHGIAGKNNIFAFPHCETDRFWRKSLGLTSEKYLKNEHYAFDECKNAFMKPKAPVNINILERTYTSGQALKFLSEVS